MKTSASIKQKEVTQFYDSLVFPSRMSHPEYSQLIPTDARGRIGDFGCGQSLFYERLKDCHPQPTFLDISLNALKTIDYGLRINADVCALPLRDETYDFIACIGVIHHLPEIKPAFGEISRVLKKRGTAIVGVYSPKSLQAKLRNAYDIFSGRWKKIIFFCLVETLILTRSLKNSRGINVPLIKKRTQDLLETPLVRYLPVNHYILLAKEAHLELTAVSQISSMTILRLLKF